MVKRTCQHCKKELEFKNGWAYGSHIANCAYNPNYKNKIRKSIKTRTLPRIKVIKHCEKCGKEFEVEHTISKNGKENISKREKRFCSYECACSVGGLSIKGTKIVKCRTCGKDIKVTKRGRNFSYCDDECRERYERKFELICQTCEKKFKAKSIHSKFCSRSCRAIYANKILRNKYSQQEWSLKVRQTYINGKKVYGGKTKWLQYKNIKVQGTFELRTCKILDSWKEKNLIKDWEYTNDRYEYMGADNQSHTYLLDFKIFNHDGSFYYIETKGYKKESDELKWNAIKNLGYRLEIWFEDEIEKHEMESIV